MSEQAAPQLRIVDDLWRQLSAIDALRGERVRRAARRRRGLRMVAIAASLTLGLAAVAVATNAWLVGAPAEPAFPVLGGATPATATAPLLDVRVPDPDGGPAWGMRTYQSTARNTICLQVGRVVDGLLVGLGINGAFGDDGRAHPLPLEAEGCAGGGPVPRPQQTSIAPSIHDSSAALAQPRCEDPQTRADRTASLLELEAYVERLRDGPMDELARARAALEGARANALAERVACPAEALRTIVAGLAGPAGATVTLADPSGRAHTIEASSQDGGAYLFVLQGQLDLQGISLSARYPDGRVCPLPDVGGLRPERAQTRAERAACLRSAGYD